MSDDLKTQIEEYPKHVPLHPPPPITLNPHAVGDFGDYFCRYPIRAGRAGGADGAAVDAWCGQRRDGECDGGQYHEKRQPHQSGRFGGVECAVRFRQAAADAVCGYGVAVCPF